MINIFNLGTKTNSNPEGIKEGVHYKILKDGHGIEHKILNFENEEICPRSGIIELMPMRVQRGHAPEASFRVIRDKEFGVLVGIPMGIDPKTKQIIWQKITLIGEETLDLSIPEEAMKWACIRRSHLYTDFRDGKEMNPNFQQGAKTKYKAVDKEREAITFQKERKTKRKATEIAESLYGEELKDMARNCGIAIIGKSSAVLEMEVYKFAEKESAKFMEVWLSDTRVELSVLNRAKAEGIVNESLEAGINYGGLTLGFNTAEALKYLKDHPQTLNSLDVQSKKNEQDGKVAMNKPEIVDEKDAEIQNLKKQVAELEKKNKKISEKALESESETVVANADSEFAELLAKAKQYGIKGAHLIKDKDKLKEKVEAAEKQASN